MFRALRHVGHESGFCVRCARWVLCTLDCLLIVECLFQDYVMIVLIMCLFDYFVFDCFVIIVGVTRKIRENCES